MSINTFCAVALLGAAFTQFAEQAIGQPIRTDLTCVENMSVPQYDGGAWVARFSGTARVLVKVGADGAPISIEVQSSSKPLTGWLRYSLQDAMFSTRCAGQTIEINFIYELRGKPTPAPHSKVRLRNINTFEVVANPPIPILP